MSRNIRKILESNRSKRDRELIISDENIGSLTELPGICSFTHLTRLNLSHNRLDELDPNIFSLSNLEYLNVFNNNLEELPGELRDIPKLRELNAGLNRLVQLPRGFGSCPSLQVLDLTYNNLTNGSFPGNFKYLGGTLRALFLGDNELLSVPLEIGTFLKLEVLVLRDNNIRDVPVDIGRLPKLKELHLNGNQIHILPPDLGLLDFSNPEKSFFRVFDNPLIDPLREQCESMKNNTDLFVKYLKSPQYLEVYTLYTIGVKKGNFPPLLKRDRSGKKSRKTPKFKPVEFGPLAFGAGVGDITPGDM
ncbi:Ras suppressor protein 1-like [Oopsacas minuta]|uniref:Ras suppressor protein 1-like n=1 Tax=Oopsacas minuta TaxID=111878 RepID=A0AAV7KBK1_9METZ|nr:Ras suppressor protein 1-like [Oopsacas minuta]